MRRGLEVSRTLRSQLGTQGTGQEHLEEDNKGLSEEDKETWRRTAMGPREED